MTSRNFFSPQNVQADVSFLLRFFALHLEKYFSWVSTQPREQDGENYLKMNVRMVLIGTCFVAFAAVAFLVQHDFVMALGCTVTWIGSILHLARGRLCFKAAKLLQKFQSPLVTSRISDPVTLPQVNFFSFDIAPPKRPPRATLR